MYGNYEMMKRLTKDKLDRRLSTVEGSRRERPYSNLNGRVLGLSLLLKKLLRTRQGEPTSELDHRLSSETVVPGVD